MIPEMEKMTVDPSVKKEFKNVLLRLKQQPSEKDEAEQKPS